MLFSEWIYSGEDDVKDLDWLDQQAIGQVQVLNLGMQFLSLRVRIGFD